jgi:tetratricopeptide (TPR) repeat protein
MSKNSFGRIIVFVFTIQLCAGWIIQPTLLTADCNNAEWHYTRGRMALIKGDFSGAIKALDSEIGLMYDERFSKTPLYLGIALARLEYYDRALDAFEKCFAIDSRDRDGFHAKSAVYYHFKGLAQIANGQYYQAANYFDRALETYDSEVLFGEGLFKTNRSSIADVFDEWERKLIPDFITIYIGWHTATGILEEYLVDRELNDSQLALDLALAFCHRGIVTAAFERYAAAIKAYNAAIKRKPDLALAYIGRGYVKSKLELHSEAVMDYDRAIELLSNNAVGNLFPVSYYLRGEAKYKLGKDKTAVHDMQNALRLLEQRRRAGNTRASIRAYTLASFIKMTIEKHKNGLESPRRRTPRPTKGTSFR